MTASIPPDGEVSLGSVRLPAGTQLSGLDDTPLLWATSAEVPNAGSVWLRLHEMQHETGLAPIPWPGTAPA
jgi:hypothetical protein